MERDKQKRKQDAVKWYIILVIIGVLLVVVSVVMMLKSTDKVVPPPKESFEWDTDDGQEEDTVRELSDRTGLGESAIRRWLRYWKRR